MRLLLDTHTFIWYVTNNQKLSLKAQELINDGNNIEFDYNKLILHAALIVGLHISCSNQKAIAFYQL